MEQMAGVLSEIVAKLAASGASRLYMDGGITIQEFLRAGLINRMIISRLPVLIGEGIPLFGSLPHDRLQHVTTRTIQAAWSKVSIMSCDEKVGVSNVRFSRACTKP